MCVYIDIIKIFKMEPFEMKNPNLTIFTAKRNSGKSHMIKYMLYKASKDYNDVIVMCPTTFHSDYPKFMDKTRLIPRYDEDLLQHIIKRQASITKAKRINKVLVILDDCISKANFKSNIFELIATQGRHYQFSCWITTQHYNKLPPVIRLNCDYMLILGNQTKKIMQTIYDELGGVCDSDKEFSDMVKPELVNYGCFVVNNLSAKFHTLRAPENVPEFRINISTRKR
jgi:hypothetical protein